MRTTMKLACRAATVFHACGRSEAVPHRAGWALPRLLLTSLLLLAGWLWTVDAQALTMTRSPGACETRAGIGTVGWTNPQGATAPGGAVASAQINGATTNYLWCTGYGFSIPAGAVINGITVNVTRRSDSTAASGSKDASMRLLKSGAVAGTEGATGTTYTTTDVTEPHGGATSLWGTTWSAADINASNFGAAFAAIKNSAGQGAHTISVDHVQIVVDYSTSFAVTSISRASANPTTNGSTVSWTVTFSAAAFGVSAADFALVQGGTLTGSTITGISGSGASWTVSAKVGSDGDGDLGLNLVDSGTIKDADGNPLGGSSGSGGFTGDSYTISKLFCSPPAGAPNGLTCVCDTFGRSQLNPSTIFGANWIPSTSDDTGIVPGIVSSGRLRLTNNTGNNAKAVTVPGIFPAAGNYISVEFQLYAYNGTGADGVAVTLSDYSVPAVPGAFGGSLGYAQKTGTDCGKPGGCPGFAGGWLGVGLDEFGNYSNPTEGRIGGPGAVAQSIGLRGSGSGATGYNWIGGKTPVLSPTIDSRSSSTAAPGHTYQVVVDARNYTTTSKNAAVQVNRDTGSGYVNQIDIANVYAPTANPTQAPVPDNWQISFTGSTGGSTNIHEIGAVRICAQYISPPGGGTATDFNAIDEGYGNASASPSTVAVQNYLTGHIYTKLIGVPFKLNVAALKDNQVQSLYVSSGSKNVAVKLVDNSDNACVLDDTHVNYCSNTCKNKAAVPGGSQTLSFTATDKGQKRSADFTINSTWRQLAAIITDADNKSYCATDAFSVRPVGIASLVSSNATNTGNGGTPIFKAGSDKFALTATIPGIGGSANGYTGVPKIDSKAIKPVSPATKGGDLLGTFAAATSATPNSIASGSAFTYSEVGAITLPGYPATNASALRGVYDGVVGASECPTSGPAPVTPAQCDAFRAATWTGIDSVSAKGDCVVDSYSNVQNTDGKYGCNFGLLNDATFGRFVPSYFQLSGAVLSNRTDLTCSPASSFTYMDEPLQTKFTLTAKNAGGLTTENYAGLLAKLSLSDPASFKFGALDGISQTNRITLGNSSGAWAAGVASDVTLGFQFQRATTGPDGPFAPRFGIAPVDGDGVALLASAYDLDIDAPAAANDHAQIGQTAIRFGRLKLSNAFGSEKLDLPIPLEAQFWNGVAFVTNSDDNCSPLVKANVVVGNYAGGLSATNLGQTQLTGVGTLVAGKGTLKLSKPGAVGGADLAIKLAGSSAGDDQSCPSKVVNPTQPTGAGLAYLQSRWCGADFTRDPRARIRFGVYKNASEMIYLREMY